LAGTAQMPSAAGPQYPNACLRGLRSSKHVHADLGQVATEAYMPDSRTADGRADGRMETSINWEDEPEVVGFSLAKKDQAKYGLGRLPRSALDLLISEKRGIDYDRDIKPGNKYHGNILYAKDLSPPVQRMLAGFLALSSEYIAPGAEPAKEASNAVGAAQDRQAPSPENPSKLQ